MFRLSQMDSVYKNAMVSTTNSDNSRITICIMNNMCVLKPHIILFPICVTYKLIGELCDVVLI